MKQILSDLVSMHTISDNIDENNKALDYIELYLQKRGMYCKRHELNGHGAFVASSRPDNLMHPKVLLAAHIDVMHGKDELFKLREADGKLYGRGVYDMKSAAAAYLAAVDELQDNLSEYDFGIMITTDEEYGSVAGRNSTEDLLKLGYRADIAVLPDGGRNWQVEHIAKGYWRFELIADGKTAHGSRPWQGESATDKLIDALKDLKGLFVDQGPETETLNIAILSGGTAFNQIPDHASARVEIRIMSEAGLHKIQKKVTELCKRYKVSVKTIVARAPLVTDVNNPLIQAFMESVRTAAGKPSEPCISYAASDAAFFQQFDIPCVVTYPIGGMHHSDDEWIDESVITDFPAIIRTYLDAVAKQPESVKELAELSND